MKSHGIFKVGEGEESCYFYENPVSDPSRCFLTEHFRTTQYVDENTFSVAFPLEKIFLNTCRRINIVIGLLLEAVQDVSFVPKENLREISSEFFEDCNSSTATHVSTMSPKTLSNVLRDNVHRVIDTICIALPIQQAENSLIISNIQSINIPTFKPAIRQTTHESDRKLLREYSVLNSKTSTYIDDIQGGTSIKIEGVLRMIASDILKQARIDPIEFERDIDFLSQSDFSFYRNASYSTLDPIRLTSYIKSNVRRYIIELLDKIPGAAFHRTLITS